MSKKILFVAMQMSIHTARWINQIADEGWDIHLFPVNQADVHSELRNITVHLPFITIRPRFCIKAFLKNPGLIWKGLNTFESLKYNNKITIKSVYPVPVISRMLSYLNGFKKTLLGESKTPIGTIYGPAMLARLIKKIKPDMIHSLEFQHCGYNVLRAKELYGKNFPQWLATNWGSDIYHFSQFETHRSQISRLLANVDYYSCECDRDITLAKKLGYSGPVMQVMPNTGGFNLEQVKKMRSFHKPSERKIIMVKGYQHFVGRAFTALDALEICHKELKDYVIVLFSASPEVIDRANELKELFGLRIVSLRHTSHSHVLKMFGRARIYLGISLSDAISTSLLEAMALGAFPIQTNTSCCTEWIEDGKSGFSIPPDDLSVICDALREAISSDELIDRAAEINWATVCSRLDQRDLKQKAVAIYQEILQEKPRTEMFEVIDGEILV